MADDNIEARSGVKALAKKVSRLSDIPDAFDVIGIDEIHMFTKIEAREVEKWLNKGINVHLSGLDLDYRGKLIPIIARLLELKPDKITIKQAVCENCKNYKAIYTQILHHNKPVTKGLLSVVPEDGTYLYQPRCRDCFIRAD